MYYRPVVLTLSLFRFLSHSLFLNDLHLHQKLGFTHHLLVLSLFPAVLGSTDSSFCSCSVPVYDDTSPDALWFVCLSRSDFGCAAFSLGYIAFPGPHAYRLALFLSCFYRLFLVVLPYRHVLYYNTPHIPYYAPHHHLEHVYGIFRVCRDSCPFSRVSVLSKNRTWLQ